MMTIFTTGWLGLAAYYLYGRDYGAIGIVWIIVIALFINYYLKFSQASKALPGTLPLVIG